VEERLHRLEAQVRVDKVMVAFVAEFSRGKSELINAVFFAGYGRRIHARQRRAHDHVPHRDGV
jgi:hypothetical protein